MPLPDECVCPCHDNPGVALHAAPCCLVCDACGVPIKYGLFGAHPSTCTGDDTCKCTCHRTGALHARPCCAPCASCNAMIRTLRRAEHATRCPATRP